MKKILFLLTIIITNLSTQAQSEIAAVVEDDSKKDAIISAVINDEKLSAELLDTLMSIYYEQMMLQMTERLQANRTNQIDMMDTIITLMETDPQTRKKLTGMLLAIPPIKEEMIREYNLRWGDDIK